MCVCVCLFSGSHQAGWFPFRADLQNLRGEPGGAPQDEAERHQDIQEMVRLDARCRLGLCCPTLMDLDRRLLLPGTSDG